MHTSSILAMKVFSTMSFVSGGASGRRCLPRAPTGYGTCQGADKTPRPPEGGLATVDSAAACLGVGGFGRGKEGAHNFQKTKKQGSLYRKGKKGYPSQ